MITFNIYIFIDKVASKMLLYTNDYCNDLYNIPILANTFIIIIIDPFMCIDLTILQRLSKQKVSLQSLWSYTKRYKLMLNNK